MAFTALHDAERLGNLNWKHIEPRRYVFDGTARAHARDAEAFAMMHEARCSSFAIALFFSMREIQATFLIEARESHAR